MKVLIVDDHSLFRHGVEMLFMMRLNFTEAIHAENGEEALTAVKTHTDINIVALDYKLGGEDGLNIMAKIKQISPNTPIVMISGEIDSELILKALGEGAAGFIPKNMPPIELANALSHVLNGHIYVPDLPDDKGGTQVRNAVKSAEEKLAEIARKVVEDKNLSHRMEHSEGCIVTSAFNNLLDELEKERSALAKLAFNDALTGIANRRKFVDFTELARLNTKRDGGYLALVYLDLDKFKPLNDTYGHEAGDIVLIEFAKRLNESIREVDLAARLGGDEFVITVVGIQDQEGLHAYINRLLQIISKPIAINDDTKWTPSVSIGGTLSDGKEEIEEFIRRADSAMYKAKRKTDAKLFTLL